MAWEYIFTAQTPDMFWAGIAGVPEQRISFTKWKGFNCVLRSRNGWVYILIKHHLITVSDFGMMFCKVVEECVENSYYTLDRNAACEEGSEQETLELNGCGRNWTWVSTIWTDTLFLSNLQTSLFLCWSQIW